MIVTDAISRTYRLTFSYETVVDREGDAREITRARLEPFVEGPRLDRRSGQRLDGAVVGTSICSARDTFKRSLGREIALNRCLAAFAALTSPRDAAAVLLCWAQRPRGDKARVAPLP